MKYHEMLQKRETIARQMRELNDTVKTEKRSFDEAENKRWGDMLTEHDDLAAKIEREEQLRSIDEKFANEHQEEQRNDGVILPNNAKQKHLLLFCAKVFQS